MKRKREEAVHPPGSRDNSKRKREITAEAVLYVPYAPQSSLKKQVQEAGKVWRGNPLAGKVKVIERVGANMREILSNPTPWKNSHCGREFCQPCSTKVVKCKAKNFIQYFL